MPAKKMDFKSFPSSWLYSSEESQAELWKSDKLSKGHDSNQRIEPMEAVSNFSDCNEVNTIAAPDESSLFSYSLPDLLMRKLRLSAKSVDAIASHDEDETLSDSLEKIKDRIIVDLLPDDEDELFSGVNDDHTVRDSTGGEIDELDLFSSGGGLDLERDGNSSSREKNSKIIGGARSSQLGEKLYGEHLSRTLFVRDIDSDIKDSELKSLFEQFGDIHTFDRACKHQGLAMISYYDIRDAQNAMRALQSCRKFDICYSTPKDSTSQKGVNEGTLAVLCLYDSSISTAELHSIFNVYGEIKDIHENPQSQRCKLIEFYDFRAAEKALRDLNIHDTIMKKLKVEPSQYTDSSSMIQQIHSEFKQKECSLCLLQKSPPLKPITSFQGLHGISSSVPNTLPSQIKVKSVGNQSDITESSSRGQLNFEPQSALAFPPQSLPECRHGVHRNPLEKAANINLKTHERIDNNMQFFQENFNGHFIDFDEYCKSRSTLMISKSSGIYYQPPGTMLRNSPSYLDGNFPAPTLQRMTQLPMPPSHMISTVLPTNSHHVQSTPLWDRGYSYAPHYVNFVPHNMFHHVGPNFHNQSGMVIPGRNHLVNSYDTNKRVRSRRNVGASNLDDMARYELDIDRIKRGEDDRTTLMIKNIPNKYTSKMLLAAIDESHKGTYDFLYLPIDFKNKCNVGYAFINMTSPSLIVPLYEVFNGKNWKNFNSKKVASLAYARIQGKADLIAHFQNSSLMNEDMRCRPILINTDGPNAGDQVPFPIGNKQGRVSSNTHEDKDSISKESD